MYCQKLVNIRHHLYVTDLFKQIFVNLWMHKTRTILALFGIIWGTIAVIMLLALGQGFYAGNKKNLAFLDNGTIIAWPNASSKPFAGLPPGQKIHLKAEDFLSIVKNIPDISTFSPIFMTSLSASYGTKTLNSMGQAVSDGFQSIQQIDVTPPGRFINPLDIEQKTRVAVLDNEMKNILFGKENALNKTIILQGIPFTVIGITDPKNHKQMMHMPNLIYLPYTTYLTLFGQQDINYFYVQPSSLKYTAFVKYRLNNMLARRYQFDPTDDQAIYIAHLEDMQAFFQWFFRAIELFLGFCGTLTLSVGGLGIANMMFLMVTERTREIGLRMALGASQFDIMMQFMLESLLFVALGGFIGFVVAWFFLTVLQHLALPEWLGSPQISWLSILITLFVLSVVGVGAGYFPARRAANMEPVKALAF